MKSRCTDPKRHNAKAYFLKGITYPKAWEKFENFLQDLGPRPIGTTLDRIDNDKSYSKDNCRWATALEQAANRDSPKKRAKSKVAAWLGGLLGE
jgi:hypothetical protein